jgi:hypothetical protein
MDATYVIRVGRVVVRLYGEATQERIERETRIAEYRDVQLKG